MSKEPADFWTSLDELVAAHHVMIDRPKDTAHPRYKDMIYPVDYGYVEGTRAMDGGGIDVWVGEGGIGKIQGLLCSLDIVKHDAEIKLLCGCSAEEVKLIEEFMKQHCMQVLVVMR